MADIEVPVTLSKNRPHQCDLDLINVGDSIVFQNSKGNHLVEHEIKGDQIILKYDTYQCQKI
jgi:hypothetical protein